MLVRGTTGLPGAPHACQGHHRPARSTNGLAEAPVRGTTGLPGAPQPFEKKSFEKNKKIIKKTENSDTTEIKWPKSVWFVNFGCS